MGRLSKFSPIARAIAVIGATAGLVTGVTFAALTSNTVALTPNTLTTATASLVIGTGLVEGDCAGGISNTAPGVSSTSFAPGDTVTKNFCLQNTSSFPLLVTGTLVQNLSGSNAAAATTYTITCGVEGTLTSTLNSWGPGTFQNSLPAGAVDTCTATATLSSGYDGSGVNTIQAFTINFVGTQSGPSAV